MDYRKLLAGFENYKAAKNLFKWFLIKANSIKLKQ